MKRFWTAPSTGAAFAVALSGVALATASPARLSWLLWTASVLALGACVWRSRRRVSPAQEAALLRLTEAADHIAGAAAQVIAAESALAESSGKQAASLEEASSSLEEISSMTRRNADHTRLARELAAETRTAADRGVNDLQAIGTAVEALHASSGEIAKILQTIDAIAFQTNLLAINASVEAARAGSAGAGFAIVADEVAKLASRAAAASRETAGKVDDVVSWITQCEMLKVEVAQSLDQIAAKAHRSVELASAVAEASQQQADGIALVNRAVAELSELTQHRSAATADPHRAADSLAAHCAALRHQCAQLTGRDNSPPESGPGHQAHSVRMAPP